MNPGGMLLAPMFPVLAGLAEIEPGPTGYWINPAGSVIVEISLCGEDILCGHVRWASDKAAADARVHGTDPLMGIELLHRFAPSGERRWKGILFVPDLGRTSRAELRMIDDGQLKITGCAVGRMLCKSQTWSRTAATGMPSND
jgi:uncharacterized protein (DUF2147 family)